MRPSFSSSSLQRSSRSRATPAPSWRFFSLRRLRSSRAFYCLSFLLLLSLFAVVPLTLHLFPLDANQQRHEKAMDFEAASEYPRQFTSLNQPLVSAPICSRLSLRPPLISAHGGDSSRAPPNTLAAYQLAVSLGVDAVEVDASLTADGILVALHDRDLQHFLREPHIRVADMPHRKLRSVSIASPRGEPLSIPTLMDAIKWLQSRVSLIIIDVKPTPLRLSTHLAADVLQVVEATSCRQCLIWCKDDKVVLEAKRLAPTIRAGYIVMKDFNTGQVSDLLRYNEPEVVAVFNGIVNDTLVKQAHNAGKEVHAWTVDDVPSMHRMIEFGVDAVVTGQPSKLKLAIEYHKKLCQESGLI